MNKLIIGTTTSGKSTAEAKALIEEALRGDTAIVVCGRSPISIATGGWVLLEEDFGGSSKAEARARAVIE